MLKAASTKKTYRPALLVLAVVIPGLIIGGFGILSISQQEKANVLKLREEYTAALERTRKEIETAIETAIEDSWLQLTKKPVRADQPGSIQQELKKILLENPVVKYPFLIDSRGEFIFPFTRKNIAPVIEPRLPRIKNKKLETCIREGEGFEFGERKINTALRTYIKCLEFPGLERVKPLKAYIFNAIGRCYFKKGRYPQAIDYYQSIMSLYSQGKSKAGGARDYSIYFPVLRQLGQSYQRLGMKEKAVEIYLQLYDEVLQYETSTLSDGYAFFKNEALEYLNRNIRFPPQNPGKPQSPPRPGQEKPLPTPDTPDRLREFAGPEVSLRWQYIEYEDIDSRDSQRPAGLADRAGGPAPFKNKDALHLMKIREFYLSTSEKDRFYRAIKEMNLWKNPANPESPIKKMKPGRTGTPTDKNVFDIVYIQLPANSVVFSADPRPVFFGYLLSPGILTSAGVSEILKKNPTDRRLRLFILSKQDLEHPWAVDHVYRYPLLSVGLGEFFPGQRLVLMARDSNYFHRQARQEIRFNYVLMAAFVLVLILGVYFFYKYQSREADLVRLKSEFTDSASHTLKTPLTRIRMLTEKLQLGWVTSESKKQEYFRTILSETDRMNEMITNMLDFSKIEAGRKQYHFENASLAGIVKEVLESYGDYIKNSGFELHEEIEDNVPLVPLDTEAIRLVAVNLLQNAMKYSLEVKYIGIRVNRENENLVLEVEDKGMGIRGDEIKKIFERFYRAPGRTVQMIEGSGLGLYLVQHVVQAHHGKINVTGEPGKGSRFVVLLPVSPTVNRNKQ